MRAAVGLLVAALALWRGNVGDRPGIGLSGPLERATLAVEGLKRVLDRVSDSLGNMVGGPS